MGETNIQWTARHRIDPEGTCAHGATGAGRCLDVGCERCWVQGHTVNPWIGCEKVSAACKNCYAETVAENRMGISVWGKGAPRSLRPDAAVKELLRIHRRAKRTGQRVGVFSGSMCDIFEDRDDLVGPREIYLAAVGEATDVDVMLLTKRSENIREMVPPAWLKSWPKHVWPGATTETQEMLDERAPHLLRLKAAVTFLSVEPMLGPIDAREYLADRFCMSCRRGVPDGMQTDPADEVRATWIDPECPGGCPYCGGETDSRYPDEFLSLIIPGGESGGGSRPLDVAAAESLVKQCVDAGAALFFKQMGSRWAQQRGGALKKGASHGQDPYRWPAWARRRDLPGAQ